jgi:hypothetical protein
VAYLGVKTGVGVADNQSQIKKNMKTQKILRLAIRGGWLWDLPENEREEAELAHDIWLAFISEYSKKRHTEVGKVRKLIRNWKESPEICKDYRRTSGTNECLF